MKQTPVTRSLRKAIFLVPVLSLACSTAEPEDTRSWPASDLALTATGVAAWEVRGPAERFELTGRSASGEAKFHGIVSQVSQGFSVDTDVPDSARLEIHDGSVTPSGPVSLPVLAALKFSGWDANASTSTSTRSTQTQTQTLSRGLHPLDTPLLNAECSNVDGYEIRQESTAKLGALLGISTCSGASPYDPYNAYPLLSSGATVPSCSSEPSAAGASPCSPLFGDSPTGDATTAGRITAAKNAIVEFLRNRGDFLSIALEALDLLKLFEQGNDNQKDIRLLETVETLLHLSH